ncbi:MAG: hypothetical protein H0T89_06280 [Deltaproteobacteria bacterium]|nr:hypothetical protein [Deltaproteobacteria bacterium]MDQ3296645.1 hypothetical protein [Myxococcota bacterium]
MTTVVPRALLCGLVILATGCLMPRPQPASGSGGGGGGGGWSGLFNARDGGSGRCVIHVRGVRSLDPSSGRPPSCPSEGWLRQIVRDIPTVDRCVDGYLDPEVNVILEIGARGRVIRVSIERPTTPEARRCIVDALWGWEFAPAPEAGELRVVYRPDPPRGP